MDEITDVLGQLSTSAKEWRPAGSPSRAPLHAGADPKSPRYQPASSPTISSPQSATYRTLSFRPTQPGRKVYPGEGSGSDEQWQPRNEWSAQDTGIGSRARGGSGGGTEFVPGSNWAGSVANDPPPAQTGWDVPVSTSPVNNENQAQWQEEEKVPSTLPSGPAPPPPVRSLNSLGVSDAFWRYYRDIALECRREMDASDPRHKAIPPNFLNAFPLDDSNNEARSSFGYPTSIFRVMNRDDGHLYCLRRLDSVQSSYKIASAITERWQSARNGKTGAAVVEHPGLVRFYRMFLSNRAVFFIHDYIPGCATLRERFMDPNTGGGVSLPEPLIWSCVTQLVSVIRAVHAASLACRTLQLNHILCSTPNWGWGDGDVGRVRLRLNCVGIADAVEFEARKRLAELQRDDMIDLGHIILSLATGTEISRNNCDIGRLDNFMGQNYSQSLRSLAISLAQTTANVPSIVDVSSAIADRVFDELDASYSMFDRTDAVIASEYESGRALRLLLKIGFVNERPEFAMNRRWSESGDCYVLKLFRDYVFHQADGAGRPMMDLGHVITAMNKLDAADEEKIVLTSRDGKSLLVVSYTDVARCLDTAFNELCSGSVARYTH